MARVAPLSMQSGSTSADLQSLIDFVGYRPNALFTMAKRPGLLDAVLGMVRTTIRGAGRLPEDFRFLIGAQACRAAGCRYSAAHAAHAAAHAGMAEEKIAGMNSYESSPLFSPEERAALELAAIGGRAPMGDPTPAFAKLQSCFDEDEQIEIVAIIALFGWFNRWNCLIGSDLEDEPAAFAKRIPWLDPVTFSSHGRPGQ
jgi:alkylhydroperoxidase family enzyme